MHDLNLRLFFALWPSPAEAHALAAASAPTLRLAGGRAVATDRLHVTLAFLGSVPAARISRAHDAADSLRGAPIQLNFDRCVHQRRSGILWAEPAVKPAAVQRLHADLRESIGRFGLSCDSRRFRPHVTLARKARDPGTASLAEGLRPEVAWRCASFCLVQSQTDPHGARYTVLRRWALDQRPDDAPG